MARGKKCPCCGMTLYAHTEDHQEKGTWVTYICRNGACARCGGKGSPRACNYKERVFEGK